MASDPLHCRFTGGALRLCEKRNLRLTIDGVHLNDEGARIYQTTILEQIKRM